MQWLIVKIRVSWQISHEHHHMPQKAEKRISVCLSLPMFQHSLFSRKKETRKADSSIKMTLVRIAESIKWLDWGWISWIPFLAGWDRIIFLCHDVEAESSAHQASHPSGWECESDPSSAQVKNKWSFISLYQYPFIGWPPVPPFAGQSRKLTSNPASRILHEMSLKFPFS
jgi:hypothetical protein